MYTEELEKDLYRCLGLMSMNWRKQENTSDTNSSFIYKCDTLKQCLEEIRKNNADRNYALHRWYNYKTSIITEEIFCKYGAKHCEDLYNHDVDIYITEIPFDVKLTCYPIKLFDKKPYDLSKRSGKNNMIRWLYENQSQGNRKQLVNRLYVMCDGDSYWESVINKSNFNKIEDSISKYMDYIKTHKINEITIDNEHKILSDLICVKK